MAQVTPTQVNPGEEVTASSVNTPVNQLAEGINNIDNSQIVANAAIAGTKLADGGITPAKLSDLDWHKRLPAYAHSSVVAGTWIQIGTTGTGSITGLAAAQSAGAQNEEVQYKVVLPAGTYSVFLYCDKDINRGVYTISVDGASIGTFDAYGATRVAGVVTSITTSLSVPTSKLVTVNVKMASKNASSAGYYANFFEITLVRTA